MQKPKLALVLFLLIALPAYASYHMELVAEFELPTHQCWDVQHWTSDSTYGWVTANGNEITYCLDINNPEVVTFEYLPCEMPNEHERIRIYGSGEGCPMTVAVCTFKGSEEYGFYFVSRLNVESQQEIVPKLDTIIAFNSTVFSTSSKQINEFYVWPPPPSSTSWLVGNYTASYFDDGAGLDGTGNISIGRVYSLFDSSESYDFRRAGGSDPFAIYDSLFIIGEGSLRSFWMWDHSPPTCSQTSERFHTYFCIDSAFVDTLCHEEREEDECWGMQHWPTCGQGGLAVAQVSSDGSRRAFFGTNTCFIDSAGQFVPAWTNADIPSGTGFSALMPDSPNEHFLVVRQTPGCEIGVFDAKDGIMLGEICGMLGRFQYVLKQRGQVSHFVTFDEATNMVRIYEPHGIELSLSVLPASNSLQLNWHPVEGASSYTVWLQHPPPLVGPYFIGTTADTSLTVPIPAASIGYFTVETNY